MGQRICEVSRKVVARWGWAHLDKGNVESPHRAVNAARTPMAVSSSNKGSIGGVLRREQRWKLTRGSRGVTRTTMNQFSHQGKVCDIVCGGYHSEV